MKKLLSALLAVAMLLSLAIPATFVAAAQANSILADGSATRIDLKASDFKAVSGTGVESIVDKNGKNGDFVMVYMSENNKGGSVEGTIPVTVQKDGMYNMTFVASNDDALYDIYVDGLGGRFWTNRGTTTYAFANTVNGVSGNEYFNGGTSGISYEHGFTVVVPVYLKAGDHNIIIKTTEKPSGKMRLCMDYISFAKSNVASDAQPVAADGSSRVTFSLGGTDSKVVPGTNTFGMNMSSSGGNIKTEPATSSTTGAEEKYFRTETTSGTYAKYKNTTGFRVPVDISVPGMYIIEVKAWSNLGGGLELYTNNSSVAIANTAIMEESGGDTAYAALSKHRQRFYRIPVYLEAGYNNISGAFVPDANWDIDASISYVAIYKSDDNALTASVPAEGGKIELEGYSFQHWRKWQTDGDNKLLGENGSVNRYLSPVLIPVNSLINVAASDTYNVEFIASEKNANSSKIELLVDGKVVADNTSSGSAVSGYTYLADVAPMRKYTARVDLTAGTHRFQVAVYETEGTKVHTFAVDNVSFAPVPLPVGTIPSNGKAARIDLKASDFRAVSGTGVESIVDKNGKNGDFVMVYMSENNKGGSVEGTIPVTVQQDGMYNMTFVASNDDALYDIYVDGLGGRFWTNRGTTTYAFANTVNGVSGNEYFNGGTSGISYEHGFTVVVPVYLKAGNHNIIIKTTEKGTAGKMRLCMDYISFAKSGAASDAQPVAADGSSRVTFSLGGTDSKVVPGTNTFGMNMSSSGGNIKTEPASSSTTGAEEKYFRTETTSGAYAKYKNTTGFRVPVDISVPGMYIIEVKAWSNLGGGLELYADNSSVAIANTSIMTESGGDTAYAALSKHRQRFYRIPVYLEAGYNNISGAFVPDANWDIDASISYVAIYKDNVTAASVPAEGKKIELEEYSFRTSSQWKTDGNNKLLGEDGSVDRYLSSVLIPVNRLINVAASGKYDVEFVASEKNANSSKIELLVDGKVVADNTGNSTAAFGYTYLADVAPMTKYTARVDLTEGTHRFQVVVYETEGTKRHTFAFDYAKFTPLTEGVTISSGNVSARGIYDSAVSGHVILALYNGNELVHIAEGTANGEIVEIGSTFAGTATKAKLFVWEDCDYVEPVVAAKVFNLN